MRVFVTGATGFIGTAVVRELHAAGHSVLALARSDAAAATLVAAGAQPHRGELVDTGSLAAGARAADGVIHCAFIHDFSTFEENALIDQRALAAMADAMAGTGKPLVATSGTAVLKPGQIGTEDDLPADSAGGHIRAVSELVLSAAANGVRVSVVRLAPTVHGRGDTAFVPALIALARKSGVSAHVGDGANRWPAVHRLDAARLFVLALQNAVAGTRLHGAAEEGIAMHTIAGAIGAGVGVPVKSLTEAEAVAHFGWLARFVAIDNPVSSAQTRAALGWQPVQPGLIADLRDGGYF